MTSTPLEQVKMKLYYLDGFLDGFYVDDVFCSLEELKARDEGLSLQGTCLEKIIVCLEDLINFRLFRGTSDDVCSKKTSRFPGFFLFPGARTKFQQDIPHQTEALDEFIDRLYSSSMDFYSDCRREYYGDEEGYIPSSLNLKTPKVCFLQL